MGLFTPSQEADGSVHPITGSRQVCLPQHRKKMRSAHSSQEVDGSAHPSQEVDVSAHPSQEVDGSVHPSQQYTNQITGRHEMCR